MSDRLARIRAVRFCGLFGSLPVPQWQFTYSHQDFDKIASLTTTLLEIRGDGDEATAHAIATAAINSARR